MYIRTLRVKDNSPHTIGKTVHSVSDVLEEARRRRQRELQTRNRRKAHFRLLWRRICAQKYAAGDEVGVQNGPRGKVKEIDHLRGWVTVQIGIALAAFPADLLKKLSLS